MIEMTTKSSIRVNPNLQLRMMMLARQLAISAFDGLLVRVAFES